MTGEAMMKQVELKEKDNTDKETFGERDKNKKGLIEEVVSIFVLYIK